MVDFCLVLTARNYQLPCLYLYSKILDILSKSFLQYRCLEYIPVKTYLHIEPGLPAALIYFPLFLWWSWISQGDSFLLTVHSISKSDESVSDEEEGDGDVDLFLFSVFFLDFVFLASWAGSPEFTTGPLWEFVDCIKTSSPELVTYSSFFSFLGSRTLNETSSYAPFSCGNSWVHCRRLQY